ncbi:DUF3185 domain-containing protein [Edaphobacter dinghuensis]|nr:DUF3185 domain-containing protein [Edaphobacter dinghuensis]
MKVATIAGILLIILGVIGFVAGGVSFSHTKKDLNLGPLKISHEKRKTIPISPIVSAVALVAGIGLVVMAAKDK